MIVEFADVLFDVELAFVEFELVVFYVDGNVELSDVEF
jgi:hypothetical protein